MLKAASMELSEWQAKHPVLGDSLSNAESLVKGAGNFVGGAVGELESMGRGVINAVGHAVQKAGMAGEKPKDLVSPETKFPTIEEFKKAHPERYTTPTAQASGMEDLGAGLMGLAGLGAGKLKDVPVGGSLKDPGSGTMAEVLKGEPYTLKTLERLPQNKGAIPTQTIKEQLKRADVSKPERDILEPLTMTDGVIKPEDIVSHFKQATKDYELTPHNHGEYSDYGMENIGRGNSPHLWPAARRELLEGNILPPGMTPSRTTTWQVPEGVSGSTANHFQDPRYFGHTRAFEEDGVPHVVEVQSDLMQRGAKPMDPRVRADLESSLASVKKQRDLISEHERRSFSSTADEYLKTISDLEKENPDFATRLMPIIEESDDPWHALATHKAALKKFSQEGLDASEETRKAAQQATDFIDRGMYQADQHLSLLEREHTSKLNGGGPAKDLSPMKKTHQQRLVKEELRMAADSGAPVRFATSDTVAKVEMWPEPRANALSRIEKHKADIADLEWQIARYKEHIGNASHSGAVDGFSSKVKLAERDIARHKDIIQNDEEIIKNLGPARFTKEHQGIYDNYKDLEKYLRDIGGTSHTDRHGHSWIEVDPKNPNSPVKNGRTPMFAAAPFAMGSANQYNTPNKEAAK